MAPLILLMTKIDVPHLARDLAVKATAERRAQVTLPAAHTATVEAASEPMMPTTWNLIPPTILGWIVAVNAANPQERFAAAAPTQLTLVG